VHFFRHFTKLTWVMVCLVFAGCASMRREKLNVSYRLVEVVDGDSVFILTIDGQKFEIKSSNGGLEFYENKNHTVLRVSVFEGKGTYFGDGIDYYYYVDGEGRVICLGRLKASWYEDEQSIGFQPKGFERVKIAPSAD